MKRLFVTAVFLMVAPAALKGIMGAKIDRLPKDAVMQKGGR